MFAAPTASFSSMIHLVVKLNPTRWKAFMRSTTLSRLNVPLRKSTDLLLLFHRNDQKLITATHNGHTSHRKPDIILVFQTVTQAVGLVMPSKQPLSHPKMILNGWIVCPRGNSNGLSLLCRHLLLNIWFPQYRPRVMSCQASPLSRLILLRLVDLGQPDASVVVI